jgi:class 3 adenylate cyclase
MESIEEKTHIEFSGLLSAISSPMDEGRLARIAPFLHPECNGFGTAFQEIFKNKDEWSSLFREELVQLPNGIQVSQKWAEIFPVNETMTGLMAEIIFVIRLPNDKKIDIDPVRVSAIYKREADRMLVIHLHLSYPFGEANDEIFPGSKEPRLYEEATVLFTDFVGFTNIVSTIPPKKLLSELNELYGQFDDIIQDHHMVKIKTIGDAYMAVAGLNEKGDPDHAVNAATAGTEILKYLENRNKVTGLKWNIRAGIHSGVVVGGVIGRNHLQFDVWGDTVNTASRIVAVSETGRINLSAYTYDLIKERFPCEYRGRVNAKGKGEIDMYFINHFS